MIEYLLSLIILGEFGRNVYGSGRKKDKAIINAKETKNCETAHYRVDVTDIFGNKHPVFVHTQTVAWRGRGLRV